MFSNFYFDETCLEIKSSLRVPTDPVDVVDTRPTDWFTEDVIRCCLVCSLG